MLTSEDIVQTIDLELEALMSERDLLKLQHFELMEKVEGLQSRINLLTNLVREMQNGSS
jgi:hypothetical protein